MALDPEFVKRVQERKAKREARERRLAASPPGKTRTPAKKKSPVFRSVSMATGETFYITGEDADRRVKKAKFK